MIGSRPEIARRQEERRILLDKKAKGWFGQGYCPYTPTVKQKIINTKTSQIGWEKQESTAKPMKERNSVPICDTARYPQHLGVQPS